MKDTPTLPGAAARAARSRLEPSLPHLFALLVLAAILPGCATSRNQVITSSFDEVISGQRSVGSTFPQVYVASVNGLLPLSEPGELYFYPEGRGVLGAIGISSYTGTNTLTCPCACAACATRTNCPCVRPSTVSYNLVREHPSAATREDLEGIRTNIARASSQVIQSLRLQRQALAFLRATNAESTAAASNLMAQARAATDQAETALAAVRAGLSRSNVFLFQWTASEETSGGLRLGALLKSSSRSSKSLQGYALVAGFRTSTFFVGEDMTRQIYQDMADWSPKVRAGLCVPTFMIEADRIVYFSQSDLLREIQADLKVSARQFKQAAQLVASLDEIEVKLLRHQLENLSNSGFIQGPARSYRQFVPMELKWRSDGQAGPMQSVVEEDHYNGWSPFYSVYTRTRDVVNALVGRSGKQTGCAACPCARAK